LLFYIIFILSLALPDRTSRHFIFRAHCLGIADTGSDIFQHDIGKMKSAAEYAVQKV
jgi:hypothetical protein